jgi:hypothetical protein
MIELGLPWLLLLALGALHGLNPGMGWLFAVALGLQEEKGRAVWRALPPLALGHALAVGVAVLIVSVAGLAIERGILRWMIAAMLFGVGIYRLVRHRHARFGGMRVSSRDLTIWSFLMATAHGAGLMVVPTLLNTLNTAHSHHANNAPLFAGIPELPSIGLVATALHTAGYLLITGAIAAVVYRKLGLRLLRTFWFNLDIVWAGALVVTALATALL